MHNTKEENKNKRGQDMLLTTLIMGILAVIFLFAGYLKGGNQHIRGLKLAIDMSVKILPMLLFAFIIAGMIEVLLPKELISGWIGRESGMRGIFIGTVAGGFCPGGPYVSLPVVAGLLRSGASIPTTVAFLTSWSLWAFSRLPMEVGILGWRFTLFRLASTFIFPFLAGLLSKLYIRVIGI